MNHRSIPSLSSSISSQDTNQSPRSSTSSSSTSYYMQFYEYQNKQPSLVLNSPTSIKRWDDSQLEMELAEDDLISDKRNFIRRNSSLRLQFISTIIRKRQNHDNNDESKFKKSIKKLYNWIHH